MMITITVSLFFFFFFFFFFSLKIRDVFIARFSLVCISIFPQKQTLESAPRLRLLIA